MIPSERIDQLEKQLNKLQKDCMDIITLPMFIPEPIKICLAKAVRDSMVVDKKDDG